MHRKDWKIFFDQWRKEKFLDYHAINAHDKRFLKSQEPIVELIIPHKSVKREQYLDIVQMAVSDDIFEILFREIIREPPGIEKLKPEVYSISSIVHCCL